ncbi:hypothetical protein [uncultured Roseibium sp.]|uniref:hypothetical protein n=1 Tax=uncultured Roseibium sp. TaxID=1936171 RepID=UPI00259141E8|nr:hypothetical protein [uncultured Roseibium sp.]
MTIGTLGPSRAQIAGDGMTGRVDLEFAFVDQNNLRVIHTDANGIDNEWIYHQAPGSWYFTGGSFAAGSVHFTPEDLPVGDRLTVVLSSGFDQPYDFDGGEIDPSVIERALDRSAVDMQAVAGKVERALSVKPTVNGELPDLEVPDLPEGHGIIRKGGVFVAALLDTTEIQGNVVAAQAAQAAAEATKSLVDASSIQVAIDKAAIEAERLTITDLATEVADNSVAAIQAETNSNAAAMSAANSADTSLSNANEAAADSASAKADRLATSEDRAAVTLDRAASEAAVSQVAVFLSETKAFRDEGEAFRDDVSANAAAAAQSAADAAIAASGDASNISITPTGSISSTNVQDALEELDSDKAAASHSHTLADISDLPAIAESATASTVVMRNSSGDVSARYIALSHSAATRSSETVFFSSSDSYVRKNNKTGMLNSLDLNIYESPEQALTFSGSVTMSHGLGRIPRIVTIIATCKTDDKGYSAGEYLVLNPALNTSQDASRGFNIRVTSTQIKIGYGTTNVHILRPDTGGRDTLDSSKWKFLVRAM